MVTLLTRRSPKKTKLQYVQTFWGMKAKNNPVGLLTNFYSETTMNINIIFVLVVVLGLKILWSNSILFVHCRASDFFGPALIRGPIQLPQTPQNFKWLTVLSVPLSLSPKLLFGQRLQNCVRNNIPYHFFGGLKDEKKCRGISLFSLYFLIYLMQYILYKK